MMRRPSRIAVIANSAWYLQNFRLALMAELRRHGHEPVAVAPPDGYEARITGEGFPFIPLPLRPSGTRPLEELGTLTRLRRLLAEERFDIAFTYTPKVNIYVGLARKGLRVRHVPNVSGLGVVFAGRSSLAPLVRRLYRVAFSSASAVVFQNEDDRQLFVNGGIVDPELALRVPGSGVDLERFRPVPVQRATHTRFLFIGRVLKDKGIYEFVEAAQAIRALRPDVSFAILGSTSSDNPTAIAHEQVLAWEREGVLNYLGASDDVRPFIAGADCVVLPSYREGVPRVLLEAAAMERPCITTDAPGCRDAVDDGRTGLICRPRDAGSLRAVLEQFLAMPHAVRLEMGRQARLKMEREFDERLVLQTYVGLAAQLQPCCCRCVGASSS